MLVSASSPHFSFFVFISGKSDWHDLHDSKVVFYWDQPFQPKPVLVDLIEAPNRTLFQPFLGIVISRLPRLLQRLSTCNIIGKKQKGCFGSSLTSGLKQTFSLNQTMN